MQSNLGWQQAYSLNKPNSSWSIPIRSQCKFGLNKKPRQLYVSSLSSKVWTKVTEYLHLWCFFSPDKFRLFHEQFLIDIFLYHSNQSNCFVVLRSNLEKQIFHLWFFFVKLWRLKIFNLASLAQLTFDILRALNG